eukprot:CAMPEP_0117756846 /NCGR_PEP_ID=MMETSP0947-20121206/14347_1 /TAXON_ID=44440 /ORGANISM="Chattonella subsalsa, Strain CCMP2191" /LENGTH=128 /DNA_ID=CAMNT_0005576563 /DNA_START=152 /DNA_END=538 /DNA_ORIENTATION=+
MAFTVWDISGKEKDNWSKYYLNTQAIIFVIDATQRDFSKEKEALKGIREDRKLKGALILIYANKQDEHGCKKATDLSKMLGLEAEVTWNKGNWNHWKIQGCCGLTGDGLYQGLDWLVKAHNHSRPIES